LIQMLQMPSYHNQMPSLQKLSLQTWFSSVRHP
jgi:hypothetical protein